MKIAAYQFAISNDIKENYNKIEKAVFEAKKQGACLIVFPECCLTGYPPRNIDKAEDVDFGEVEKRCVQLQDLSDRLDIYIIVGTIYKEQEHIYNRAICFQPNDNVTYYDKRALYGWDSDNFDIGNQKGIFEIQGIRIGIRICFEIRFPEYFRELYKEKTDINIVLFYDVSDTEDNQRYEMIKGHIQTRAVENVTTTISVNTIFPYQTAPTAVFDKSGGVRMECGHNEELLIYEYTKEEDSFGEAGRRRISNQLQ